MVAIARDRNRARFIIVGGFAVTAIGSLVSFVRWLYDGDIRYSSNEDVQYIAATFAVLAGVAAWWFLSQIVMNDATPRELARRALLALMFEELCFAVTALALVAEYGNLARNLAVSWPLVGNALIGLGALVSAIGFYSMLRTYRGDPLVLRSIDD
jgi:tellurite resistance protein TehA-like permease